MKKYLQMQNMPHLFCSVLQGCCNIRVQFNLQCLLQFVSEMGREMYTLVVYMQSRQLNVNRAANQTSLKPAFYLIESTFMPVTLAGENQREQLAIQRKLLFQFPINCCGIEQNYSGTSKLNVKRRFSGLKRLEK